MLVQITSSVSLWLHQVRDIVRDQFVHLEPREYTMGLVLCIAVGWIMLNGRR